MKPDRTVTKTRKFVTAFAGDQSGAVAAYVAILMVVLIGFVGLAVDIGRLYTTHSQAQAAADAAALAAATQLDGKPDAIDRAIIAAMSTPLVNNNHDFAQGDATVQIVQLRFLHSLPDSDDDPITNAHVTNKPGSAGYVEATTETLTQFNAFMAAVGVASSDTVATAVAGNNTMQCEIPPLMICNPWEDPLNPAAATAEYVEQLRTDLRGKTLLAKTKEGGVDSWDSGVMGLLDPPPTCKKVSEDGLSCEDWDMTTNTGTKAVALSMAKVPEDFCYPETPLSIRTGQASAMRSAVNIWFDIYENPFFGAGKYRKDPAFRPARNVTKGYITDWVTTTTTDPDTGAITTSTTCEATPVDDPNIALGLPPDSCFGTGPDLLDFSDPIPCETSVKPSHKARIGDGNWDILKYWQVNHNQAAVALPGSCIDDPDSDGQFCITAGSSRYEVYRWEIESGNIPNNKSGLVAPDLRTDGEDGAPICYTGGSGPGGVAPNDTPDRRTLSVAVINCLAEGVAGNSVPNSEAVFFAEMFVMRPIRGGSDGNIWLEFIDFSESGDDGVHDIIQLYR